MNIKMKKSVFFNFHMEMLGPHLLSESCIYTKLSNAAWYCYYQRRDYILYQSFPISLFLKQEMVAKSK